MVVVRWQRLRGVYYVHGRMLRAILLAFLLASATKQYVARLEFLLNFFTYCGRYPLISAFEEARDSAALDPDSVSAGSRRPACTSWDG